MEEKKGVYKKKGAAEESDAQEAKNDVNDMEGGMTNAGDVKGVSKKKGGAAKPKQKRKEDKLKKTAKQLADPDTNLKDFSRKLKKYRKTKKQIKEIKDDGVAKKKGAGRTVKQLKDKKQEMQDTKAHKKMGVKAYNKKIGRLNKKIARKGGAQHIDGKEHGAANYEDGYPPTGSGKKKGASKKKGAASFEGGLHAKNIKHSKSASGEVTHDGAKKAGAAMGFTQNFGPARQNSYAKGAAKVASIMGYGASKKKGAADDTGSPHPPHPSSPATMSSINSTREGLGSFEGTKGGGGYSGYGGQGFGSEDNSLPKGVVQDYQQSGGNANPIVAKDVLQSALDFTKKSTGNNTNTPFKANTDPDSYAVNMSRANYSPSDGVSGIDPQTGRDAMFGGGSGGMRGSRVENFSSNFQDAMRTGIKVSTSGANELTSKGVAAPPSITANTLTTPTPTNSTPPPKGKGKSKKRKGLLSSIQSALEPSFKFKQIGRSKNKGKNVYR